MMSAIYSQIVWQDKASNRKEKQKGQNTVFDSKQLFCCFAIFQNKQ